ncbi:MAG: LytR C-terminal domain-containing protein [Kiloniellales bacterium]
MKTTPESSFTADMTPYERGKRHIEAGHLGLALQSLRRALAEQPDSVETLNAVAAAYDRLGRFDLAGRYYRRALSVAPRSAQTLNNMGYSFMLQGRLDDASRYLERARALNNAHETIAANLTVVQRLAGAKREQSPATAKNEGDGTKVLRESPRLVWIERNSQKVQTLKVAVPPVPLAEATERPVRPADATVRPIRLADATERPVLPADATERSVPLAEATERPVLPADATARPIRLAEATERPVAPRRAVPASWKEIRSAPDVRPNALARLVKLSTAYHGSELREARIEVSNGAGRRWMAARSRAFLTSRGANVRWLTNAKHFSNMVSVIFHRKGFREQAEMLARLLPIRVRVEAIENQRADVRLKLGGDLLDFDRRLISIFGRDPYYASAKQVIAT